MSTPIKTTENQGLRKLQIKRTIISSATIKDAPILSRIYLRAFEHDPNRSIPLPHCDGLFGESLLQKAQASETRRLKTEIVGTDVALKATVQYEDDTGRLVDVIVGYGRWTNPDGPRRRTVLEWILSTIVYPIYDFFSPLPGPSEETKQAVKEVLEYQVNATFGPGSEAYNRRYWYLHMLYVDPDWQGCGIGNTLLKWSFDKATESNSVVYLESSPMGLPVYLAKGFRITSTLSRTINGIHLTVPGMIWEPTLRKNS